MVVVANTSPINYLILTEEIETLPKLYRNIIIPAAVRDELLRKSTPDVVRNWAANLPAWLAVRAPKKDSDALLAALDAERDAISLAQDLAADQLIIDDRHGRQEAKKRGIHVMGTLGVLREAAVLNLLDLPTAVRRLQSTTFYIAPEVLQALLKY